MCTALIHCTGDGAKHDSIGWNSGGTCCKCHFPAVERIAATVTPSITGDRAQLWLFGQVRLDIFDDAQEALENAEQINRAANEWVTATSCDHRWIPVAERLPETSELVAVAWTKYDNREMAMIGCHYLPDQKKWNGGWWENETFTHWLPLPPLPSEADEEKR